jgi:hypothetical protein
MDLNLIFIKVTRHIEEWEKALSGYSEKEYYFKPSPGEWSFAQVYEHLIRVSEKCIDNSLKCSRNQGEKGHSGFGPAIFSLMGSFPPVKIRVKKIPEGMDDIYLPKEIKPEEARKELRNILQKMKDIIPETAGADKSMRLEHWAGGWFNAQQWYHSAEMHLKHHFRQKKRLERLIKKQLH